jgi:hypothetical protein
VQESTGKYPVPLDYQLSGVDNGAAPNQKLRHKKKNRSCFMRGSIALSVAMLVCCSLPARAQDEFPRTEVSVMASLLHPDGRPVLNLKGWHAELATNYNKTFGILADFAGVEEGGVKVKQYLFGPRFNFRRTRVNVFGHGLFGSSRSNSGSGFTLGLGGGLDINLKKHLSVRPLQVDWLTGGVWNKDAVRISIGVVIPFG